MSSSRTILVPRVRLRRWFENFESRHGQGVLTVHEGQLRSAAEDGEVAIAALPFGRVYDGPPDVAGLVEAAGPHPTTWGVLLVRKGGFAVAALEGTTTLSSKVGQRHVQGRTKAGGQSQQRFSRRRDNQARQAYEAAAEHTHRILVGEHSGIGALVCGGDRSAVDAVLAEPRLAHLSDVRVEPWLPVPDPRRAVLDQAILDAQSVRITLAASP